jgi:peptidoglycan/xylan/chitin deacetylase (PgdA/CDA1 family)
MTEPERADSPPASAHPAAGQVWLTFDDGPDPRWTPQILAILAANHVHATFCLVGNQVAAHPQSAAAEHRAGEQLCNHSWDHSPRIRTMTAAQVRQELAPTTAAIRRATGTSPRFFRAPYGYWTATDRAEARAEGMTPLSWTLDPRDWSRPGVAAIEAAVRKNIRPGTILLMHDGGGNRSQTVAALRVLLPELRTKGYRFAVPQ